MVTWGSLFNGGEIDKDKDAHNLNEKGADTIFAFSALQYGAQGYFQRLAESIREES